MKTLSRLLLSVVLFVGFLADSSFGKAFGPRAASPAAFSATNAAWYSLAGSASDSTYLLSGGNVTLIADRSGNSAVNGLVLNGASGNYASAPDSAAVSITGDIDLRAYVNLVDWTPALRNPLISKWGSVGIRSYLFTVEPTTGVLTLRTSADGSTGTLTTSSTVAPTVSDFGSLWVRVTLDVDNGAAGNTTTFYTSSDGIAWTQLGSTVVSGGVTSIFDSTAVLGVGINAVSSGTSEWLMGQIYRAQIYNGIGGTLAFDANFTTQAKLATSFTESSSNAATVTINTSGDLGARICGARDLVQLTAAKMPAFSVVAGYNTATGDGSNDYLGSPKFPLAQPMTWYHTFSSVTWVSEAKLVCGSAGGVDAQIYQIGVTPNLSLFAGNINPSNNTLAVGTKGVVRALFNGASSALGINLAAANVADAGSANANAITLFADFDGTRASNTRFYELLVRSAADDTTTQNALTAYEMLTWGITP